MNIFHFPNDFNFVTGTDVVSIAAKGTFGSALLSCLKHDDIDLI